MQPGCLALVGLEVPTDRLASVNVHLGTRTRPGRAGSTTDLALGQQLAQVVPGRAEDQATGQAVDQATGQATGRAEDQATGLAVGRAVEEDPVVEGDRGIKCRRLR